MIARDQQRQAAIERIAAHLLEHGLSRISLRQLAAAAGVSDRMLLYYFADKSEALGCAAERIAGDLGLRLAAGIPADAALAPLDLMQQAAHLATAEDMRPYMRLWIEIVAAAARRQPPFVAMAGQIAGAFLYWLECRLALPPGEEREAIAAMILAAIDGLALVDVCSGAPLAARAAAAIPLLREQLR